MSEPRPVRTLYRDPDPIRRSYTHITSKYICRPITYSNYQLTDHTVPLAVLLGPIVTVGRLVQTILEPTKTRDRERLESGLVWVIGG